MRTKHEPIAGLEMDIDLYALPEACILCDEEAGQFELCADHLAEFINWNADGFIQDFLAFKIRTLRAATAAFESALHDELNHMRMRARNFKALDFQDASRQMIIGRGFELANSILKHADLIAKEVAE